MMIMLITTMTYQPFLAVMMMMTVMGRVQNSYASF
jgi:hypothetical protein